MPQASNEQRALMEEWFGDEISDRGPYEFLLDRGWIATRGGILTPPVSAYNPSVYELECVYFLCDEWDYGYNGKYRLS